MVGLLFYSEQKGTGQNGMIEKKEWERNDLAEGPCSRTERNNLKKVRMCPALYICWNLGGVSIIIC